jgi:hypothetical protein
MTCDGGGAATQGEHSPKNILSAMSKVDELLGLDSDEDVDRPLGGEDEPVGGAASQSQYLKIISKEGHEFIVDRDVVMCSTTIKTMLSGPGILFLFYSLYLFI